MPSVTAALSLVSDADSASSQGTWSGNSGGADTEVKIQGSGSYTWQAAKNARTSCTFTPTTNLDMSATDTHLYWWAKNDVAPFMEAKTTGSSTASGYTVRLTDGSANYKEWHVAGSDTWGGEWKCFVLDLANTSEVYASSGTLDLSDIDVITWYVDISNSGNIRIIDNQWNDVCRFGTGLVVTSTTTEDFDLADVAAVDQNSSNRYGILELIDGVLFCKGRLTFGDASGSNTTSLVSSNETLYFLDRTVSASLYQINAVASATATTDVDITGLVTKTVNTSHRCDVDLSDSDLNSVSLDACTLIQMGLIDIYDSASITNCKFDNCLQIDPGSSTFEDNTVSNYVGSEGGALLWPGGTTVKDCIFLTNQKSIEITQTSNQTYDGLTFPDEDNSTLFSTHLNNGGTSIEVAKTNGANPQYYTATGGGTVTFTASYTHTLTNLESGTEVTYVTSGTTTVLFHVESASTPDGGGKYKTVYTHSGGATVDILINHPSYLPDISDVNALTLPNSSVELKISMFPDPNYYNPA
ncbi:MAG: hypothetical protein ACWGQW_01230 [bacterium]